ncbi:hypothetical protein B0O80DRAFT_532697 [Mortierella sp. GBAus27b]|nr:hypothetical protein B0O80DRAFT_532697 [Mortierella sp. GBAus27b]
MVHIQVGRPPTYPRSDQGSTGPWLINVGQWAYPRFVCKRRSTIIQRSCPFGHHPDHVPKVQFGSCKSDRGRERSTVRLIQSQIEGMVWVIPASRTSEHYVCLCSTDRVSRPLLALPSASTGSWLSSRPVIVQQHVA